MEYNAQRGGRITAPEDVQDIRDVALRDMVNGYGGNVLIVGLDDFKGFF